MYCNVFVLERIFLLYGDANGVKCALLMMMMPSNSQRRALLANMNRVLETKVLTQKRGDWAAKVPLFVSRDSM